MIAPVPENNGENRRQRMSEGKGIENIFPFQGKAPWKRIWLFTSGTIIL